MLRSNFKSLIEAATGVPVAQQKLFFGPWGILEDNRKALEGEPGMRFFFLTKWPCEKRDTYDILWSTNGF